MSIQAENNPCDMEKRDYNSFNNTSSVSVIKCSKIVCYNKSATITKWALDTNEARLSISPSQGGNETCTFDLSALNIDDGTQFVLKAIVVNNCRTSNVVLEYNPNSNITANFRLERTSLNPFLIFLGTTLNKYKKF